MISVLIADDEEPARLRLRHLLQTMEHDLTIATMHEACDGEETLQILAAHPEVAVVFLDIQMPGLSGLDVVNRLPAAQRPYVIFTTAFDEYALQAFEQNALDYLTKPISRERMAQSLQRVADATAHSQLRIEQQKRLDAMLAWMATQEASTAPSAEATLPTLTKISIPHRDKLLLIDTADVVSAEVTDGVTKLYVHQSGVPQARTGLQTYIVSYTLDQLEARLSTDTFARVHRSALVNVNHIESMVAWFSGRYKLLMTAQHEVIASRDRSRLLKERFAI